MRDIIATSKTKIQLIIKTKNESPMTPVISLMTTLPLTTVYCLLITQVSELPSGLIYNRDG